MAIDDELQRVTTLLQRGNAAEAEQRLSVLLHRFPEYPDLHRTMAMVASQSGRPALALEHMAAVCRLAPDSVQSRFQLGCLLAHDGQFERALEHFRFTTSHLPGFPDGWYFLGLALTRSGRDTEALRPLRQAHRLAPGQLKVTQALADVEFRVGYPADGLPLWQSLLGTQPGNIDWRLKTGETLSRLGYHQDALAVYREGVGKSPEAADLWMALAQAEEDDGNRTAAQQAYEQALVLRPGWAFPLSGLLGLRRGQAPDALVREAAALQDSPALPDPERALIGYELGKVYDGRGAYGDAIASWHDANAARQRMTGTLDPAWLAQRVDRTIAACGAGVFRRSRDGDHDPRFVFVVGMPRSGTTLTEQIIANHPQAFGCGELPDIALIARNLPLQLQTPLAWPEIVGALDSASLRHAIDRYSEAATRHAPADALRLVDKAPLNFFHLGLIALMFPGARVVWCRRDPRDVALSIYGENFSLEEKLATSLAGIGHYINAQNRLMRHWQSVLPMPILELQYEQLVSDLEPQAQRLVEFTGLPWNQACLDFHKSDRGVQTPSRWQVRQPVHTRSVGRWRHYEEALAPLLDVLDAGETTSTDSR